jgi:cell wall-associated NlpC family hydrolase
MLHTVARPRALVTALLTLLTTSVILGGMVAVAPDADAATRGDKVRQAARVATKQVGDPYRYGAAGPDRFDCSGLVYFAARRAGLSGVPRTSGDQARHARRISKSNLRRGDLMFFHDGGDVYHVAIFLRWKDGRRVMVHSPSTGQRVHRATPWTSQWYAGTLRRR